MSSHHRNTAKATEELIVNTLNGQAVPADVAETADAEMGRQIAARIQADFEDIYEARHVGNSYDSVGDIVLDLADRTVFLEIKSVKSGTGTLSNLSGDVLTNLNLFENTLSWSEFRSQNDHHDWVAEELNRFDYTTDFTSGEGTISRRKTKGRELKNTIDVSSSTRDRAREVADDPDSSERERLAADIILTIHRIDEEERLDYLDHLHASEQNPENIRKFAALLSVGVHKTSQLRSYWDIAPVELESELSEYYIYYGNRADSTVHFKDPQEYFESLLSKTFSIEFDEGNLGFRIVATDENGSTNFVRGQLYWGNVFQGIATPRINMFEETLLEEMNERLQAESAD